MFSVKNQRNFLFHFPFSFCFFFFNNIFQSRNFSLCCCCCLLFMPLILFWVFLFNGNCFSKTRGGSPLFLFVCYYYYYLWFGTVKPPIALDSFCEFSSNFHNPPPHSHFPQYKVKTMERRKKNQLRWKWENLLNVCGNIPAKEKSGKFLEGGGGIYDLCGLVFIPLRPTFSLFNFNWTFFSMTQFSDAFPMLTCNK